MTRVFGKISQIFILCSYFSTSLYCFILSSHTFNLHQLHMKECGHFIYNVHMYYIWFPLLYILASKLYFVC
jgi:hypothetical protein